MAIAIDRRGTRGIAAGGLVFTALFVAAVIFLMNTATYREWAGPLVAVAIILVSVPVLVALARREDEPLASGWFVAALLVKLLAAPIRHYLTLEVEGTADAVVYHRVGAEVADLFRAGSFDTTGVVDSLSDTGFIELLTGIVYTFIGPTSWGGFVFFSWLSFWGSFLIYRAFVTSVPGGSAKFYFSMLFFLPSMLYWPASIGKEGWMMFAIGVAVYGSAKTLRGNILQGAPLMGAGLWAGGIVRPHVSAFLGVGFAAAVLARRTGSNLKELAPLVKVGSIVAIVALAVAVTVSARDFLRQAGINTEAGLTTALADVSARTGKGDSYFTPPSLASPTGFPLAVVTVLYRPFVFEAHNAQALVSAVEAMVLGLLTLVRWRRVLAAVRAVRSRPYIALVLTYVVMSIIGLSSFANFGLLVRQRTLLLPFFTVLLSVPVQRAWSRRSSRGRVSEVAG